MTVLLEPFAYGYMVNAIWVSGAGRRGLRLPLRLPDAEGLEPDRRRAQPRHRARRRRRLHARPAVRAGAFLAGALAAAAILSLAAVTRLKQDAVIGADLHLASSALGLFMVSLSPTSVNVQTIMLGNILAITPGDTASARASSPGWRSRSCSLKWRDLMAVFFDEPHARSVGLPAAALKVAVLRAARRLDGRRAADRRRVPRHRDGHHAGATAYLLTDRFGRLIALAAGIGAASALVGRLPRATSSTAPPAAHRRAADAASSSPPSSSRRSTGCSPRAAAAAGAAMS